MIHGDRTYKARYSAERDYVYTRSNEPKRQTGEIRHVTGYSDSSPSPILHDTWQKSLQDIGFIEIRGVNWD